MNESPTQLPRNAATTTSYQNIPKIPIEIVSEEEMAFYETALAATCSSFSSSSSSAISASSPTPFRGNARSIQSITQLSKRKFSSCTETSSAGDIEDSGGGYSLKSPQKRSRAIESFLHRFRRRRGLAVTDITSSEWCEKQMEFFLQFGKPQTNKAMKSGHARHLELEEEVIKRVKVRVESEEDAWSIKFLNFILGANQLLLGGLTRELPLIGFLEGVWIVGVIDEIRLPIAKTERNLTLVETKTRVRATIPAEPQQRSGRLQLMCYKYLWDSLVADNFPSRKFFDFFSLNPHYILSKEIRDSTAKSGFPAKTLDDLVRYFRNTCCTLPSAHDQLLLRYEFQDDRSLLGEDQFTYDSDWVKGQIQHCLEFWLGEREANYTPEEERWKCGSCSFAPVCPVKNTNHEATTTT